MDITILAVSKRLNGVCIAGLNENNRWIRPVKKEELMLSDIKTDDGKYVASSCRYEIHLAARAPIQCQTENYLMDPGIRYRSSIDDDEKKRLFPKLCENNLLQPDRPISDILKQRHRSLVMLGPVIIETLHLHREEKMKAPEMTFSVNGVKVKGVKDSLLCTDLKFWQYSEALLKNLQSLTLTGQELKSHMHYDRMYLIIGLTKLHKGINWPMVIGLHTIPDYRQNIDYGESV